MVWEVPLLLAFSCTAHLRPTPGSTTTNTVLDACAYLVERKSALALPVPGYQVHLVPQLSQCSTGFLSHFLEVTCELCSTCWSAAAAHIQACHLPTIQ